MLNGDYWNAALCVLTLLLMSIPSFVERRIKIDVPDTLEIIILLFIFAAEIMGEIRDLRQRHRLGHIAPYHSGFICAAIGFALFDILNRCLRLSFHDVTVFCGACGLLLFDDHRRLVWGFFEAAMDVLFRTDMQKDTIVRTISSVSLNHDGEITPYYHRYHADRHLWNQ